MKKAFDERCKEYKKQLKDFQNNNEAIEALKKAHAKELAAHVQEHNKKYNQLLQEKLDSEDQLKEQAAKDRKQLDVEWQFKAKGMVDDAKRAEQAESAAALKKKSEEYLL